MIAPTWYAISSTTVSSATRYGVAAFARLATRFHPIGKSLMRCGPWRDTAARRCMPEFCLATMDGTERSRDGK
jgi:hypothetical protein